jgi:hypothetical protein
MSTHVYVSFEQEYTPRRPPRGLVNVDGDVSLGCMEHALLGMCGRAELLKRLGGLPFALGARVLACSESAVDRLLGPPADYDSDYDGYLRQEG